MLGISPRDVTAGYRVYRAGALRRIGLEQVESRGYCFQVDLTLRTLQAGLTVVEMPITFVERAHGASKMSKAIILEALWRVTRWGMAARLRMNSPRPRDGYSSSIDVHGDDGASPRSMTASRLP
jgi:dolichol-phosphate mannosyltransferase